MSSLTVTVLETSVVEVQTVGPSGPPAGQDVAPTASPAFAGLSISGTATADRFGVDATGYIDVVGDDLFLNADANDFLSYDRVGNIWNYFVNGALQFQVLEGGVTVTGYAKQTPKTVAALAAAGTAGSGARDFVSDANATTFASIVAGGGSNNVPVYSDGTNWRIG